VWPPLCVSATTQRGLSGVTAVIIEPDGTLDLGAVLADVPPPMSDSVRRRAAVLARRAGHVLGSVVQGAGVLACGLLVAVAAGLLGVFG
jgi:hypothetical protein